MKWTKKLPTKPGWYWFKEKGREKQVVKLISMSWVGGGIGFGGFRSPPDLKIWPGIWAGPIKEPK